jgi:hypothetical protein
MTLKEEEEKLLQMTQEASKSIHQVCESLKWIEDEYDKRAKASTDQKEKEMACVISGLFKIVDNLYQSDEKLIRNVSACASMVVRVVERLPKTSENKTIRDEIEQIKKNVQTTLQPLKEQLEQWNDLDLRHRKEGYGIG